MKILTWNTGLFSWFKYAPLIGLKLNGKNIHHEYFQLAHADAVIEKIREIGADVLVLQEFHSIDDREYLIRKLKDLYPYATKINTWYHDHAILVLSSHKIDLAKLGSSEFYTAKIGDIHFIPIHLNSFSAIKRLEQIKSLMRELKNITSRACVLGDTNFWNIGGGKKFLFSKDKISYDLLCSVLKDCTESVGSTTKVGMGFDKIFISKTAHTIHVVCQRKNERYMDHYPVSAEIVYAE